MAHMIPGDGPWNTGSNRAEPLVYKALSKLDDQFTIIHSLPWITSAVRTIDPSYAPTGEIDFIILHPQMGILVIEVKGGEFAYDRHRFVYIKTKQEFDPIGQIRKGTFALSKLIQKTGIPTTVGYAWIFPDVVMQNRAVPPALIDVPNDERLFIDYRETDKICERVIEIMRYWRSSLRTQPLSTDQIQKIVDAICPQEDYTPSWDDRIEKDNRTWLTLNSQQRWNLNRFLDDDRTVVTGRPGTGKTVLAMAAARIYAGQGKSVLILFFNSRISEKINAEMKDEPQIDVSTFHALCIKAEQRLGTYNGEEKTPEWFTQKAQISLQKAIRDKKMISYDVVIVDEGQVFRREWYDILRGWIPKIHVFCDETQSFSFENPLTNRQVEDTIAAERVGTLTVNMRSPMEVFKRLEIALPTDYEQFSMRPSETDTLQEIVSFNLESDLTAVIDRLHRQKVYPNSIAVLTSTSWLDHFKETSLLETLKKKVALVDTSSRARGLEYPVVIVCGIAINEHNELVNAYARATSRVIAIYHFMNFHDVSPNDPRLSPFLSEMLKKPEVRDAIQKPWEYTRKSLGWLMEPVPGAPFELYWNKSLGAWVMPNADDTIAKKLWEAHFLRKTHYPSLRYSHPESKLTIFYSSQPERTFGSKVEQDTVDIIHCPLCGELAIQHQEEVLCVHCKKTELTQMPILSPTIGESCDVIVSPQKYNATQKIRIGLHLMALAALEKLASEKKEIIISHVIGRFPSRNGYQALLILSGIELLTAPVDKIYNNDGLVERYGKWVAPGDIRDLRSIIPNCTSYWFNKGWLSRVGKGIYKRTGKIASLHEDSDKDAED